MFSMLERCWKSRSYVIIMLNNDDNNFLNWWIWEFPAAGALDNGIDAQKIALQPMKAQA